MSPYGNGRCSHCEPAESRRWRSGKGGRFFATPPRQRRRHVGLIGPVPRRGGGGGGGVRSGCCCGDASHSDPDLGSNGRCRSGDGPPRRMDCGWGDHPVWMVHLGHLGVSSLEALVGCLAPLLFRGIAWLLPGTLSSSGGTRRTTRKRWLKGRRRGRSGSDPRRLFGRAELWICQGWIRRSSVPIALTGPALTTPPG